ncbi:hypothetical protein [Kitasatospora sp. CB02891]|uniref:hypothetical protein n=1 Tax=Kitasatospora sp. CB02891 TaxID=2020329 RepID=UPI000C26E7CD|nr:hypothetical protein [Kitasatospora sp. CB02891]
MNDKDAELAAALDEFAALLAGGADPIGQDRYEQVESTRLLLGQALTADPARTARLADRVLSLLVLEASTTGQLVGPLVAAIGRKATLAALISRAGQGRREHRANACRAAYWVAVWTDPAAYRALFARHRSDPERLRRLIAETRERDWTAVDPLAELWPHLWLAAAVCFTTCDDPDVRRAVETAFPLEHPDHLPQAAPVLAEARRIAEHDPQTYGRLLTGSTGYGAAIGGC